MYDPCLTCLLCALCRALTPIELEGRRCGYESAGQYPKQSLGVVGLKELEILHTQIFANHLEFVNNDIIVWGAVQIEPCRDVDVRGCRRWLYYPCLTCLVCELCLALTTIKIEGRRSGYESTGK